VYRQFHRLFHLLDNRKILLMSGTPMRDDVSELGYIMNLLLPLDMQFPPEKEFNSRYVQGDDVVNEMELKEILRGRVSFLNSSPDNVQSKYMGMFINDLEVEQFKLFGLEMSPIQLEGYIQAFAKDTLEERSIYSNSKQAALFVFPDGSYGPTGLSKYTTKSGALVPELNREVSKIDKLRQYSSKYAFIIQNILDNRNKLVYVYCSVVNGSGVNLFSRILNQYGYTQAKGTETREGKRFISLTSETTNVDRLLSFFNSERNMNGKYCQVIIGSRKISEGFTFKNIQIIHVSTLHWNYTETQQAIARGIRYQSHKDLILAGYDPVVQIYQHASLVNQRKRDESLRSLDVMMMMTSQEKDILIRKMDRVLKEISFDCPLTYERNVRITKDGSRECDYQECEYKCDSTFEPTQVDMTTYNLYYQNTDDVVNRVRKLFSQHFSMDFQSIQDLLEIDAQQLLQALSNIVRYNIPMVDVYGIECYLRESRNEYYLVDNIVLPNQRPELYLYTKSPFFMRNQSLQTTIRKKVLAHNLKEIQRLAQLESESQVKSCLGNMPIDIQEMVLEEAIIQRQNYGETNLIKWVTEALDAFLRTENLPQGFQLVSVLLPNRPRGFQVRKKKWKDCEYKEEERVQPVVNPEVDNPYGVYGIHQDENFCIKELIPLKPGEKVDKRKQKSGSNCLEVGWNKPKLSELCIRLNVDIPPDSLHPEPQSELERTKSGKKVLLDWQSKGWTTDDIARGLYWYQKSKEDICSTLRQWFNERNLLVQGTCGKTGKKKD
jgi:hypothetical protein